MGTMRTLRLLVLGVLSLNLALVVVANLQATTHAATPDSIAVWNNGRDRVWIWVYPEAINKFKRPPIKIDRGRFGAISLVYPGKYYLVLQDREGRNFPCGSYDLHAKLSEARAQQSEAFLDVIDLYSGYHKGDDVAGEWSGFGIRVRFRKPSAQRLHFPNPKRGTELEP